MSISGNKKVVLITGATGFVGSHLAKRLVNEDWETHIIVRRQSGLDNIMSLKEKLTVHIYDETTDNVLGILNKARPKIVFHLASLFLAEHQSKEIEQLIKSNLLFGTQLVEAMVKNKVYKLINAGTSWQHYDNEDYNPVNLYAATKQAFEAILKYYIEATSLKVITLKLFDTYGPNDPRPKLFNLLKRVAEEQKPLAMSPGEQLIDLVYIDDVVDAFVMAAERLLNDKMEHYEDYAVSSGSPVKLRDLVKIYEEVIGGKLPIEWGGRPYRGREVMVPWNKGRLLPGWSVKIGLEEGIRKIGLLALERNQDG
jgi:nucleoside-diphosphate-sugar epimerase